MTTKNTRNRKQSIKIKTSMEANLEFEVKLTGELRQFAGPDACELALSVMDALKLDTRTRHAILKMLEDLSRMSYLRGIEFCAPENDATSVHLPVYGHDILKG